MVCTLAEEVEAYKPVVVVVAYMMVVAEEVCTLGVVVEEVCILVVVVEHILAVEVAVVESILTVVDHTYSAVVEEQVEVAYKLVKYHLEVKVP